MGRGGVHKLLLGFVQESLPEGCPAPIAVLAGNLATTLDFHSFRTAFQALVAVGTDAFGGGKAATVPAQLGRDGVRTM